MFSSRRDFLKASGLVVMAGAAGYLGTEQYIYADDAAPVRAVNDDRQKATIVTIFLRGGSDALNVIVPVGDDVYYRSRTRIALYPEGVTPPNAGKGKGKGKNGGAGGGAIYLDQNKYFALNHRLAPLIPLIEQGKFAPIINVGNYNGTRSHFSAQDYMERGVPGDIGITSGWLNRYLELTKKPFDAPLRGLSAQTLVPRALRGPYPVLAGNNSTEQMDLFSDLYSSRNMVNMNARADATEEKGSRLDDLNAATAPHALTSDMTRDIIAQSGANAIERIKALQKVESMTNDAAYPQNGLSRQLSTIARVIKANVGLEVAQADYGGWDTHSGQGAATGHHSNLLGGLADSLMAFRTDLGSRMDRVLVLVMTEFGRTVNDNGAGGTDHGRGGFMFAMGDMIKYNPKVGPVLGTWNGMGDLDSGRFLPVHTDVRGVMAESLYKLYRVDPIKSKIFPDFNNRASILDFLKPLPEV